MKIGELANASGVSIDTIRFYEKRGLVRSERRTNGYRDFAETMPGLVRTIRLAQRLGFTLREIRQILAALNQSDLSQDDVAELLGAKIAEIEGKAADLLSLRDILKTRLEDVCPLGLGDEPKPVTNERN